MARLRRIGRDTLAALHRINRNPRVVGAVSLGIAIGFRCLPPIMWDRLRWAKDLDWRAGEANPRGAGAFLRRIFNQPEQDYLPWRLSDVLGFTLRRRTPVGKLWHAEHQADKWPREVAYLRKRYGITDNVEATDAV